MRELKIKGIIFLICTALIYWYFASLNHTWNTMVWNKDSLIDMVSAVGLTICILIYG